MSTFDNCLFYCAKPTETIYILVYVDDTFIFASHPDHLHALIAAIGKHYEVTLDLDATSFLGLQLTHNPDSTVTLTQPKLLHKLFALYPPRTQRNTSRVPYHPYAPEPKDSDPAPQPIDTYTYLRLLGILLFLTKSRPDIMARRSFLCWYQVQQTNRPRLQRSLLRRGLPPPHRISRTNLPPHSANATPTILRGRRFIPHPPRQ